ncbi:hypothetical protein [Succinimonas sp.]|uniref:hypothetical protein n=1 Tax=Succinimonas sp. TaxID=1936151 RepID=UPI003869465F
MLYDYAYKKLPEDACGEFLGNLEAVWFECRLEHYTDAELALYAGYSFSSVQIFAATGILASLIGNRDSYSDF